MSEHDEYLPWFMKSNNFGRFNGDDNGKGNGRSSLKAITAKTKSTAGLQVEDLFKSKLIQTPFGAPLRGV